MAQVNTLSLHTLLLPSLTNNPPLIGDHHVTLLGMHEFKLRRNDQGKAELIMRKSSAASTWLPSGSGYEVFKTTPSGEPGLANAHKDHTWSRATVENNVRQWYRYISVTREERDKIQKEWEARFAALPEDGDISKLAEDLKLKWAELPKRVSMPEQPVGGADGGHYYAGGVPKQFTYAIIPLIMHACTETDTPWAPHSTLQMQWRTHRWTRPLAMDARRLTAHEN